MRVGRIAPQLVQILGAIDDRLLIHPSYAPKLVFKHGMRPEHLALLSLTAELGTVLSAKAGALSFFYDEQVIFGKLFHMAVKTTGERHELWITTFHKVDNPDYKRRLRKGRLLRVQD